MSNDSDQSLVLSETEDTQAAVPVAGGEKQFTVLREAEKLAVEADTRMEGAYNTSSCPEK